MIEFNNQQPIYLQIAELICEQILLKKFREEERIVSVREMAAALGVNPNTVMRTYEYLQGKEIILTKRGVGYFVSTGGVDKATALRKDEFLQQDLPKLFKTAQLLNIPVQEIQKQYEAFIRTISNS